MSLVIRWHARLIPHNNLVVVHTRTEEVRDYLEETVGLKPNGTQYTIEAEYVEMLREELTGSGFIVE